MFFDSAIIAAGAAVYAASGTRPTGESVNVDPHEPVRRLPRCVRCSSLLSSSGHNMECDECVSFRKRNEEDYVHNSRKRREEEETRLRRQREEEDQFWKSRQSSAMPGDITGSGIPGGYDMDFTTPI